MHALRQEIADARAHFDELADKALELHDEYQAGNQEVWHAYLAASREARKARFQLNDLEKRFWEIVDRQHAEELYPNRYARTLG